MANTTPQQDQTPDTPTLGGTFSTDNTPPFGDPDQALYGGHGSGKAAPSPSGDTGDGDRPGRHRAPE